MTDIAYKYHIEIILFEITAVLNSLYSYFIPVDDLILSGTSLKSKQFIYDWIFLYLLKYQL